MITTPHLKWCLQDLNKANSALMGIGRVLDAWELEENDEGSNYPLKGNGYVKDCLHKGIDALTTLIMLKLDTMADLAGVDVEL